MEYGVALSCASAELRVSMSSGIIHENFYNTARTARGFIGIPYSDTLRGLQVAYLVKRSPSPVEINASSAKSLSADQFTIRRHHYIYI